jgi:hypothetical protein
MSQRFTWMSVVGGNVVRMKESIEDWWLSHLWLDRLLPVLVVAGHYLAVRYLAAPTLLGEVPVDHRSSLYTASAIVVSLTVTLASVSVGQYISGRGDRIMALKKVFGQELGAFWRGTFLGSGLAVGLFLVAAGLDLRPKAGSLGMWVFEFGALIALARFTRLGLLFGRVIGLVVLDDTAPVNPPRHEIDRTKFLPAKKVSH